MSNLSPHRPADYKAQPFVQGDRDWAEEGLFKSASAERRYGETDWTQVPKVDFASVGFNQLSIPESAEIVDDDGEFMLDDLDTLRQLGETQVDASYQGKDKRVARALTLEMEKPKYKVKDLNKSELLAREKLRNPQAKSNIDQPFIPTYGESRRALLKKLGFSDDYELSLSGTAKEPNEPKNSPDKLAKEDKSDIDDKNLERLVARADQDFEAVDTDKSENQAKLDPDTRDSDSLYSSDEEAYSGEDNKSLEDRSKDAQLSDPDHSSAIKGSEEDAEHSANFGAQKVSQSEMDEAIAKAFEEGFEKGGEEAREKAAVQESLKAEMALKDLATKEAEYVEKLQNVEDLREQERKEFEHEIQSLKEKIQSFDDSLLGELEKKKEQLELEMQPRVKLLTELCNQLTDLTEDSQAFFEPLKRLSVHIAEQLVLGELSISEKTIERLIHRCVDELGLRDNPVVKVELNQLDKATLESALKEPPKGLLISVAQNMQVGSVRVLVNDTQIEDLIHNRLETIAGRLLGQPQKWRDESHLMKKQITSAYINESGGDHNDTESVDLTKTTSVQESLKESREQQLSAQANNDEDKQLNNQPDNQPDNQPYNSTDNSIDNSVGLADLSTLAQNGLSEDLLNAQSNAESNAESEADSNAGPGDVKEIEQLKHSALAQSPTATAEKEEPKDA